MPLIIYDIGTLLTSIIMAHITRFVFPGMQCLQCNFPQGAYIITEGAYKGLCCKELRPVARP